MTSQADQSLQTERDQVADMLRTARELRQHANGDCNAVAQAIMWEKKAAALSTGEPRP